MGLGKLRGEEQVGLALAVALHVALLSLFVLRPAVAPVPVPQRISVTLSCPRSSLASSSQKLDLPEPQGPYRAMFTGVPAPRARSVPAVRPARKAPPATRATPTSSPCRSANRISASSAAVNSSPRSPAPSPNGTKTAGRSSWSPPPPPTPSPARAPARAQPLAPAGWRRARPRPPSSLRAS